METEELRKLFEGHVLNNRVDNPRAGSIRRSKFLNGAYEDRRLEMAWWGFQKGYEEALKAAEQIAETNRGI